MRWAFGLLAFGCNEYGVEPQKPGVPEPGDSDPVESDLPVPTCADVVVELGDWRAGAPFSTQADPVDASGRPFHADDFDASSFAAVTLPDRGQVPSGHDRAYVGTVTVTGSAPALRLDLQSDDGVAVWIDADLVGRWGGGWQEEGCVNDAASCVSFVLVPPVDVTGRLGEGAHRIAARVSNPVEGSYLDLTVTCVDP